MSEELTMREKMFVTYYAETFNGTQSAISAGYAEANADTEGSRLLKRERVRNAITQKIGTIEEGSIVKRENVLHGFAQIAFAPKGTVKDHDRMKALTQLGIYSGMEGKIGTVVNVNTTPTSTLKNIGDGTVESIAQNSLKSMDIFNKVMDEMEKQENAIESNAEQLNERDDQDG